MRTLSCLLLCGWTVAFSGCRSAKPPAPEPRAVTAADRLTSQAKGLSEQQNWTAAANEWKRAAEQYSLLNNVPEQAVALHNQGEAELEQGHFEIAASLFEKAAELNQTNGRNAEWWRNQIGLLQAEAALPNRQQELGERFGKLATKSKSVSEPLTQALLLNELGLWQRRQKSLEKANGNFEQAERQFTKAQNASGVAVAISNRALVAEDAEKFAMAETLWRDALRRFEELADPPGIARALAGLGRSLLKQNKNLEEAEAVLRRAVDNFGVLKKESERKAALLVLNECLRAEGKAAVEDKGKP